MSIKPLTIDIAARDQRFLRAAADVLKKYKIQLSKKATDDVRVFDVTGGQKPYVVTVYSNWAQAATCTCPDAADRAHRQVGGYCKHIIAVLLKHDDLRCQLLEVFL